jgi:hypothetical protein
MSDRRSPLVSDPRPTSGTPHAFARLRQPVEERLAALDGTEDFHWVSDEFCRFIDAGVRTGDAPWPPAP